MDRQGVIHTNDVKSKGKELNLYVSGDLNMSTNYANLTVNGRLIRTITGHLGPLGSLSLNKIIDYIPGIGFFPGQPHRGLIDIIPGLDLIPGLGLGQRGKYRVFAVDINGNFYDQKSVKNFRWLKHMPKKSQKIKQK